MFGRHRLTITQLGQAHDNTEIVMGILIPCHSELKVTTTLLEESYIRSQALQLLDRLSGEVDGLCADWREMSDFWHAYGGILSRSNLSPKQIRCGLDMFEYWTEYDGWMKLAWGLSAEVQEMLELCREEIWHWRRSTRHG